MTSKDHPTATITPPKSNQGQSGRFGSEQVAAFLRNQWPFSSEYAGGKPVREAACRIFVETLLKAKTDIEPIVLRRYNLSRFRRPHDFPTDPEDGIKSVAVTRVRLRPYGDGAGRLTIEAGRNDGTTLHILSRTWFDGSDPLANGFAVQHAKLSIEFYPRTGAKRGKILSFEIIAPNKCSLKNRTEKERLIGEKYLGRWGLVQEV